MTQCSTCERDLGANVLTERVGQDYFCVPCADSLWNEKGTGHDCAPSGNSACHTGDATTQK